MISGSMWYDPYKKVAPHDLCPLCGVIWWNCTCGHCDWMKK